ncbi:MAG: choice-of-anchor U domain-containing protein, partial [Demequina sp.]
DGAWSDVDGATFSNNGTTVTYTLTDGGELDEDGEVNGFIVDPVALAVQGTFTG